MVPRARVRRSRTVSGARGQASLMMLSVAAAVLVGAAVLFAFGNALGAKGRHQRAADLAAVSAAQVMRDLYPRLFEPPFIEPDVPNPRHLEQAEYLELARAAAMRGARRNGARARPGDVSFPGGGFAPTRVTVRVRGVARVRVGGDHRTRTGVGAAVAASAPLGLDGHQGLRNPKRFLAEDLRLGEQCGQLTGRQEVPVRRGLLRPEAIEDRDQR
jgi:hypothetical protein